MIHFVVSAIALLFCCCVVASEKSQTVCYTVEGMTCAACTITLKAAVKKLDGIAKVKASFENKNAVVSFDPKRTSPEEISKKIDSVGYKSTNRQCLKSEG